MVAIYDRLVSCVFWEMKSQFFHKTYFL